MELRITALLVSCGLAVAACGQAGEGSATTATITTTTTTAIPAPSTTVGGATTTTEANVPGKPTVAEAAIAHLAAKLGIPEEDIEVVEVRIVEWPDGALGCPEEGKMYTQAIVDGVQVLLRADERVYDYHAGADGDVFLCPSEDKDGGYDFVPPPGFDEK